MPLHKIALFRQSLLARAALLTTVTVAISALCLKWVDIPVAMTVKKYLFCNRKWVTATADMPDLLMAGAVVVLVLTWLYYLTQSSTKALRKVRDFAISITVAVPCAFLEKSILKPLFGRINTRAWLYHPELYGFHWFDKRDMFCSFPSGHALVATTILACLWRYFPALRQFCLGTASILYVALIVTNYHFVGDVVAGAGAGVLTELLVAAVLTKSLPDSSK